MDEMTHQLLTDVTLDWARRAQRSFEEAGDEVLDQRPLLAEGQRLLRLWAKYNAADPDNPPALESDPREENDKALTEFKNLLKEWTQKAKGKQTIRRNLRGKITGVSHD